MRVFAGLLAGVVTAGIFIPHSALAGLENSYISEPAPVQLSDASLTLTFSAAVDLAASRIDLRDQRDQLVPLASTKAGMKGANVDLYLKKPLAPGAYTVEWHAVAADGRESVGSYHFDVGAEGQRVDTSASAQ